MVECYFCKKFRHYECLGLSVQEISDVINLENDGIFICRVCQPSFGANDRAALTDACPTARIFVGHDNAPSSAGTMDSASPSNLPGCVVMSSGQFKEFMEVVSNIAAKAARDAVEELIEKREKRNNLVIVGMPE